MYSPPVLSQHQRITEKFLLKAGACLMHVNLYLFVTTANWDNDLLRQIVCLIEVSTETDFTVCRLIISIFYSSLYYLKAIINDCGSFCALPLLILLSVACIQQLHLILIQEHT